MYFTLEDRIDDFYRQHGVSKPIDVSLHLWDLVLKINVIYRPGQTLSATIRGKHYAYIDGRKPLPDRRTELAHEIGHLLLHAGRQPWLLDAWRLKQEWQASQFAMYALVPRFLLVPRIPCYDEHTPHLIADLAEIFCVPFELMSTRLVLMQKCKTNNMTAAESRAIYLEG